MESPGQATRRQYGELRQKDAMIRKHAETAGMLRDTLEKEDCLRGQPQGKACPAPTRHCRHGAGGLRKAPRDKPGGARKMRRKELAGAQKGGTSAGRTGACETA